LFNTLGWTYSELYDLEKAFQRNNKARDNALNLRSSPAIIYSALEMKSQAEVNLMENKYEMGKIDEAWDYLVRFEEISLAPGYEFYRQRWLTRMNDLKGRIALDRGNLDGAENLANDCLQIAKDWGYKKCEGRAERLMGQMLTARGGCDQAEDHLRTALSKLEAVGNPKQLWMTHTALARLYEKMKRTDLEREQWQAARAIVESTADELDDEQLRATFINAAPIREIIEQANR
jgi:tetratricopeptide (TPR) repeat protein